MRGRAVDKALRNGPLTHGQREAVELILTAPDRVGGLQGYAGTGKTRMLKRARALLEKRGYDVKGLAPSRTRSLNPSRNAGLLKGIVVSSLMGAHILVLNDRAL